MVLMVGAGIGVTPFASVLGDLVNRLETKKCKLCNRVRATRDMPHAMLFPVRLKAMRLPLRSCGVQPPCMESNIQGWCPAQHGADHVA